MLHKTIRLTTVKLSSDNCQTNKFMNEFSLFTLI